MPSKADLSRPETRPCFPQGWELCFCLTVVKVKVAARSCEPV
jgi:hypothetical protein